MSWAKQHIQSESYANEADIALLKGDVRSAAKFYCLAAEAEAAALNDLDPKKVRTLGITVVSATALWHKAGDFKQSKQFAERWLTYNALPRFAVNQLKKLVEDCDESLSLNNSDWTSSSLPVR